GVLKVCIAEIRAALGDSPAAPRFIETVYGRGYRFIADVVAAASAESLPANSDGVAAHGALLAWPAGAASSGQAAGGRAARRGARGGGGAWGAARRRGRAPGARGGGAASRGGLRPRSEPRAVGLARPPPPPPPAHGGLVLQGRGGGRVGLTQPDIVPWPRAFR